MDSKDLKDDKALQQKLINFHDSISKLEDVLKIAFSDSNAADLPPQDKMNHDLFIAYCLNTLYWLYLRSKGVDPNENEVKQELGRIKDYMLKGKQAIERHTLRKRLNRDVANRFIKHGIQYKSPIASKSDSNEEVSQPSRKRKFSDTS